MTHFSLGFRKPGCTFFYFKMSTFDLTTLKHQSLSKKTLRAGLCLLRICSMNFLLASLWSPTTIPLWRSFVSTSPGVRCYWTSIQGRTSTLLACTVFITRRNLCFELRFPSDMVIAALLFILMFKTDENTFAQQSCKYMWGRNELLKIAMLLIFSPHVLARLRSERIFITFQTEQQ